MWKNKLAAAAILALGSLAMGSVLAHGAGKPQHGGIVQEANDVNFELVPGEDGATIYLVDHDQPMDSKGITGKLTVLDGGKKSEAEVSAGGGNTLQAKGVKIGKGAKVVAVLNNVEGKTVTVRFTVKK